MTTHLFEQKIITTVCKHLNIEVEQLYQRTRKRSVVTAREMITRIFYDLITTQATQISKRSRLERTMIYRYLENFDRWYISESKLEAWYRIKHSEIISELKVIKC